MSPVASELRRSRGRGRGSCWVLWVGDDDWVASDSWLRVEDGGRVRVVGVSGGAENPSERLHDGASVGPKSEAEIDGS